MAKPNRVVYTAKNDAAEQVVVRGSCANLVRFGRTIATFVISPAQRKALARGGRIHIKQSAIARADRCRR